MGNEPDPIAVSLVAIDGHHLPLKKEDRLEAIKLMIERNVKRQTMAWRLCISIDALERFARTHEITLPPTVAPAHWSVEYVDRRKQGPRRPVSNGRARKGRTSEDA